MNIYYSLRRNGKARMEDIIKKCPICGKDDQLVEKNGKYFCFRCGKQFSLTDQSNQKDQSIFKPLKLFLSYPHPQEGDIPEGGKDICTMIYDALKNRGHQVWFDQEQLTGHHGVDWRDTISKGIEESSSVLSCLNRHAVRKDENGRPGVCLDELKIAVSVKGGNINTILLEPETEVKPNASLSHRQWLDMSEWKDKWNQGHAVFQPWFEEKTGEIFRMLESSDNYEFDGEIKEIKNKLKMYDYRPSKQYLLERPFVGRVWLRNEIDQWLKQDGKNNVCVIYGDPGVGKSTFAVHYAFSNPSVGALLCFEYGNEHYNSSRAMIQAIAYQLSCRLPDYRRQLLRRLNSAGDAVFNDSEFFEELLIKPLTESHIDGGHETLCIVIDALDECSKGEEKTVVDLINKCAEKFPKWLKVLVTSRREAGITTRLKVNKIIEIKRDSSLNLEDIKDYLIKGLCGANSIIKDEEEGRLIAEILTENSEGSFLYAELAREGIIQGTFDYREKNAFPRGITAMFMKWFDRLFSNGLEDYAVIRDPLSLIIASPVPFPMEEFRRLLGMKDFSSRDLVRRLQVFLKKETNGQNPETVSFTHKRIAEWITSDDAGDYCIPEHDGLTLLGEKLFERLQDGAESLTIYEAVTVLDVLEKAEMTKEHASALCTPSLGERLFAIAEDAYKNGQYQFAVHCYEQVLAISEHGMEPDSRADVNAMFGLSRCYRQTGDYPQMLSMAEQAYEKVRTTSLPSDPIVRYALEVLAQSYYLTGNYEKAAEYSEKSIKLGESTIDFSAGVSGEESDVQLVALNTYAVSQGHLGNAEQSLKTLEHLYEVRKQKYGEEDPETLTILNNLATHHIQIGNYKLAETYAEQAYRTNVKIRGENDPATLNSLGTLSAACAALGKFESAEEYAQQVYDAYKKALGEEHPETQKSLLDLSNIYMAFGLDNRAYPLLCRILDIRKRVYDAEHPDAHYSPERLEILTKDLGKPIRNLEYSREKYEDARKALGDDHPDTMEALRDLAHSFSAILDNDMAAMLFEQLYEIQKRVLGERNQKTLETLYYLAQEYMNLFHYKHDIHAFDKHKPAIDCYTKFYEAGADNPELSDKIKTALSVLADDYNKTHDYEAALGYYMKLHEIMTNDGERGITFQDNLMHIADMYKQLEQYESALEYYKQVYDSAQNRLSDHKLADLLEHLADCCVEVGDYASAVNYDRMNYELQKEKYGDTRSTLSALSCLGDSCRLNGQIEQAKEYYQRAYAAQKTLLGENHPDTLGTLEDLAKCNELSAEKETEELKSIPGKEE